MKRSVFEAAIHSDHDILLAQQQVGDLAQALGLSAGYKSNLNAQVAMVARMALSSGNCDLEVLLDDSREAKFVVCAGEQAVIVAGLAANEAATGAEVESAELSTAVVGSLIGRAQNGLMKRLHGVGIMPEAESEVTDDPATRLRTLLRTTEVIARADDAALPEALLALRSKEEQLRKLTRAVEQSPAMIVITDTRGLIEYVNPRFCQVTGFSAEDAIGKTPNILKSGEMDQAVYEEMWATILTGNEWRGEMLNRKKSGELFWELASISPVRDDSGTVTHFIAVKEDITEQKNVEQQLVTAREEAIKASAAKSEFLANMSHEIRTPLNAIIGMADLLWETELSAEQREYVRVFRRAGSTLLNLINDILDLSKVESGHLALESIEFDLRSLVEKTVEVLAVPAHEKDVELVCYVRPEVPDGLVGDPARLSQVLTNLIGNAIKFTERGEVVVEVGLDHSASSAAGRKRLLFTVRDTGIGIPANKLDAIFGRFAQAGLDTTRQYGGTGLGLTISRRLVELMGGNIRVESEVGYGSTFRFNADFGVQSDSSRRGPIDAAQLQDVRVLVVDDNSTNRFILREMTTSWGARVGTASGGRLALLELRRAVEQNDPYKLVLLDCRMPDMDGFQLAERISQDLGARAPKLVMLTSDRLNGETSRVHDLGIAAYLVKPIKRSDLWDRISTAMGKRAAEMARKDTPDVPLPEDLRPLRVLLVEDSEDSRLLVQSYLKRTPYNLDVAENGQKAIEKFTTGTYDIVLMDTQMPVLDGTAATRAIRRWETDRGLAPTPIIALTAYALREDAQRSLEAGSDVHLTKPISKARLLEVIREYTERAEACASPQTDIVEPGGMIVARVDAEIRELVPKYLDNRRNEVEFLRAALERGEFDAIQRAGHTMKGTGGGYGFQYISEIGKALEKSGLEQDPESLRRSIDLLDDYLGRVEVVFQ